MQPKKKLSDIFDDDPFGLLNVKPYASPARNADDRLIASFKEILDFYAKYNREPQPCDNIQEHQLYSRLKGIRENLEKKEMLKCHDTYGLLNHEKKQIASLSDILTDDSLGILEEASEGLFDLKHVANQVERASADFVAKRKPCKDFDKYEPIFKEVQKDLSVGKRKLIAFKKDNLREGDFYVLNGILLLLESVKIKEEVQEFKSGNRVRKDGRTLVIFENGTESNMLYWSLYKLLIENGKAVSENQDKVNEQFAEKFSNITGEDKEAGYIYILKSKSNKEEIRTNRNLYKIGYSTIPVAERVKNASQEPTFLMADVHPVISYKCYNMNPQKFEQLIHNFFGAVCLNVDVFDSAGNRYMPREWFIAPLEVIEQAIQLIISGDIVKYKYNADKQEIAIR